MSLLKQEIERFIGSVKDLPELITEFDESLWAGLIARDARVGQTRRSTTSVMTRW